jgi:HSP20 family protein
MSRPDDPYEGLQREVERLFHDLVYHRHPASHFAETPWSPPADVVMTAREARVIFELAGVPRDGVQVRLRGHTLEVSGRRQPPAEPEGFHWHRAEIYFGEFRRLVELPWEADPNTVQAVFRDGLLEVRLSAQPARERQEIPIQTEGREER